VGLIGWGNGTGAIAIEQHSSCNTMTVATVLTVIAKLKGKVVTAVITAIGATVVAAITVGVIYN